MDSSNQKKQYEQEEPRFLDFPHLPDDAVLDDKPRLNRYSSTLTKDHDFPGAQVGSLDALRGPDTYSFSGHAVRCWSARPTVNENKSSRRRRFSMVGRKSVQVRHTLKLVP